MVDIPEGPTNRSVNVSSLERYCGLFGIVGQSIMSNQDHIYPEHCRRADLHRLESKCAPPAGPLEQGLGLNISASIELLSV